MSAALARLFVAAASAALGQRNRNWGIAMRAELEVAAENGRPLRFAVGCLCAAVLQLPRHSEGRFGLTAYTLALTLLAPMGAIQIGSVFLGSPQLLPHTDDGPLSTLTVTAYQAAAPALILLTLFMGFGHLRLAWLLLERDWSRATSIGALSMAMAAALVTLLGALFLNVDEALHRSALLGLELAAIYGLSKWHSDLVHAEAPPG